MKRTTVLGRAILVAAVIAVCVAPASAAAAPRQGTLRFRTVEVPDPVTAALSADDRWVAYGSRTRYVVTDDYTGWTRPLPAPPDCVRSILTVGSGLAAQACTLGIGFSVRVTELSSMTATDVIAASTPDVSLRTVGGILGKRWLLAQATNKALPAERGGDQGPALIEWRTGRIVSYAGYPVPAGPREVASLDLADPLRQRLCSPIRRRTSGPLTRQDLVLPGQLSPDDAGLVMLFAGRYALHQRLMGQRVAVQRCGRSRPRTLYRCARTGCILGRFSAKLVSFAHDSRVHVIRLATGEHFRSRRLAGELFVTHTNRRVWIGQPVGDKTLIRAARIPSAG